MRALFDLSQKKDHPMKLISFGLGDLNIPTPDPILDKVKQALDKPETSRYSSNAGILELRTALSEKYASQYGLDYSPEDEIIVTCGCSSKIQALGILQAKLAWQTEKQSQFH